ncbi:hypothetical protein CEK71_17025 [Methylovulum psychrotolerans]|uniref:Phosphate ABC transporter substrate-binding protein n=2 Tax=Methylovulum psychrotolerans TaxID=1704499 RepID=A0A1Z4C2A0_9GAMM|nr:hypothetical protein CEK71_17025 [Methylovulum psychrotolerans]
MEILAKLLAFPLLVLMLVWVNTAPADMVLIANAKISVASISREEVINIYMGRLRQMPSGAAAQPLDLPSDSEEKALFYRLLVNKEMADIDSYWARLIFSGRASPPRGVADQKAVLESVASDPNTIGYVERSVADKRVKIILELQPKGGK